LFLTWSNNYPLSIDDVQLRWGLKNRAELIPRGPGNEDIDAVAEMFFIRKGKAKIPQFQANKVLDLALELNYDLYCKIEIHLEDLNSIVSYIPICPLL